MRAAAKRFLRGAGAQQTSATPTTTINVSGVLKSRPMKVSAANASFAGGVGAKTKRSAASHTGIPTKPSTATATVPHREWEPVEIDAATLEPQVSGELAIRCKYCRVGLLQQIGMSNQIRIGREIVLAGSVGVSGVC